MGKNRNARMPLIAAGENPGEMGGRGDERTEPVSQAKSLRLEAGNDLARDEPDLLHLILVGHEDDLLRSDRHVRLELLDALIDRPHDGAVLRRLAPGRKIPFLGEPFHHATLDGLPGLADEDRQLGSVEEGVWVLSGLLRKPAILVRRLGKPTRREKSRDPTVPPPRRALEDATDIPADQNWRMRFLSRLRIHDSGRNIVAGKFATDRVLRPETFED